MTPRQQLYIDYSRLFVFVKRLLSPDDLGLAVTAEVRDEARLALGLGAVEARQPAKTQPETDRHIELERNDK